MIHSKDAAILDFLNSADELKKQISPPCKYDFIYVEYGKIHL